MRRFIILIICWFCLVSIVVFGQTVSKNQLFNMVRRYRQTHEHAIIKEFFQLLSISNVSYGQENIRENAFFIKKMMEKRGIGVQILDTPENPDEISLHRQSGSRRKWVPGCPYVHKPAHFKTCY